MAPAFGFAVVGNSNNNSYHLVSSKKLGSNFGDIQLLQMAIDGLSKIAQCEDMLGSRSALSDVTAMIDGWLSM